MTLLHLANNSIIVSRLVKVSGTSNRMILATVTAGLPVTIQSAALEKTLAFGGVPGSLYKIFADPGINIQEGDQVKDAEGSIYTVRKGGVTPKQQGGIDYVEVYMTKG